ncbi:MAG: hypothetical protein R2828_01005 [Saprospiraceae bacterium]
MTKNKAIIGKANRFFILKKALKTMVLLALEAIGVGCPIKQY